MIKINCCDMHRTVVCINYVIAKEPPLKSTASPNWTPQLVKALKIAVHKHITGQATKDRPGIAWEKVTEDMKITKHHCVTQLKRR
jgi:hypothetical protein